MNQQVKQHLVTLKIYTTMNWPKVNLIIRLHFNNRKMSNIKNRKREIIWFNPPYSFNVLTNVGKRFFS